MTAAPSLTAEQLHAAHAARVQGKHGPLPAPPLERVLKTAEEEIGRHLAYIDQRVADNNFNVVTAAIIRKDLRHALAILRAVTIAQSPCNSEKVIHEITNQK